MSQIKGFLSPLLEKWRMKEASKFIIKGSILDIGCGEGKFLKLIDYPNVKYVGVDSNKECIEKIKGDIDQEKENEDYEFIHIFVTESLNLDGEFDNIIMLAIIEHLDYPGNVLKGLTKNLSVQGRIIITTPGPLAQFIHGVGSKIGLFDKDAKDEHKVIFDKDGLYKLAKNVGLKIEYYSSFEFGLNNLVVMTRL